MFVTITSDFDAFYVNQMIGKILEINPECRIYSNRVKPYSILEASFTIYGICASFSASIHIGVVDPDVGSKRKSVIIKATDKTHKTCYFIGPDNGIFSLAVKDKRNLEIIEIDEKKFNASKTFHGRDIFAVIAGEISKGTEIEKFGKKINQIKKIKTENKIIYIDNFGNIVTGIEKIKEKKSVNKHPKNIKIHHKGKIIEAKFSETFSDQKKGFIVYRGSMGFLEIALYKDNAKEKMKACIGDKIEIY